LHTRDPTLYQKKCWAAYSKGVDMSMIDRNVLCALLLCSAVTPLAASAADENASMHSGFQFGLGAGGGELHLSAPDTPGSINLGGFAYTFFAGYRINGWAAVEASYLDGGPEKKENAVALFKTEPHIATATGMGILPITEAFSLFARAGLAHWWYDADFATVGLGSVSFNEKSNELIWGAGTSVFFDRAMLRLEYGQTKTSPDLEGSTFDLRLRVLTLSAVWML
jgi:OmpA-OmpF porin, OOP family